MGVYLARAADYRIFKVGYSLTPASRIAAVSGGFPVEVVAHRIFEDGDRHDERYLHDCLERFRLRGEWYSDEGLAEAEVLFSDMMDGAARAAAEGVAAILRQYVPLADIPHVLTNLELAGANNIGKAFTNLTGNSVMGAQWDAP